MQMYLQCAPPRVSRHLWQPGKLTNKMNANVHLMQHEGCQRPVQSLPLLSESVSLTSTAMLLAEDDPFSDEIDIEEQMARLYYSASREDELQDLDM